MYNCIDCIWMASLRYVSSYVSSNISWWQNMNCTCYICVTLSISLDLLNTSMRYDLFHFFGAPVPLHLVLVFLLQLFFWTTTFWEFNIAILLDLDVDRAPFHFFFLNFHKIWIHVSYSFLHCQWDFLRDSFNTVLIFLPFYHFCVISTFTFHIFCTD